MRELVVCVRARSVRSEDYAVPGLQSAERTRCLRSELLAPGPFSAVSLYGQDTSASGEMRLRQRHIFPIPVTLRGPGADIQINKEIAPRNSRMNSSR